MRLSCLLGHRFGRLLPNISQARHGIQGEQGRGGYCGRFSVIKVSLPVVGATNLGVEGRHLSEVYRDESWHELRWQVEGRLPEAVSSREEALSRDAPKKC